MMNTSVEEMQQLDRQLDDSGVQVILAGFPKCGTTSLASWIDASRSCSVSNPKETYLLCPEIRPSRVDLPGESLAECFGTSDATMRAEASTLNVYSSELLESVAKRPDIKVILSVRDPVEAVLSWHNQMVQAEIAHHPGFDQCWSYSMQLDQAWDGTIVDSVTARQNYGRMFCFGDWARRWVDVLGHDRVLLIQMEELKSNPQIAREGLSRFLGLDDLADQPPVLNQYAKIRYASLYKRLRGSTVNQGYRAMERRIPLFGSLRRFVKEKLFRKPVNKSSQSDSRSTMNRYFEEDLQTLSLLVRANQSVWGRSAE